ncbi:MAG: DUF4403 family protein [Saprospiraceae bacterium]|nr:DUF4403 family protein [Saprospiraceae bacterium]
MRLWQLRRCLTFSVIVFIAFSACQRKSIPQQTKTDLEIMPIVPLSIVNLPLYFNSSDINDLINQQIKSVISDGLNIEEGISIFVQLDGNLAMTASGQKLNFTVPLLLELRPRSGWNEIKATGKMDLQLGIEFNIFQDQFLTKSNVESVIWKTKPKLSVLGLKLPVESIANKFIERYKSTIASSLDQLLAKSINLQSLKSIVQNGFSKPFFSTEDNSIHLFSSPSEIGLGPIRIEKEYIVFPLIVYLENVMAADKPSDLYNDLSFSVRPVVEEDISASVQGRIPMTYLEILLKENIEKQTLGTGLTKIHVDKISLTGEDKTIQTSIDTRGAFNGKLQLRFDPVFNSEKRELELKNFEIRALEGKKLDKTLLSLVKGIAETKVKAEIEKTMNNMLRENKNTILEYLNHKEIYPGMVLNGELKNWNITDLSIVKQVLFFNVNTALQAKLNVLRLDRSLFQSKN